MNTVSTWVSVLLEKAEMRQPVTAGDVWLVGAGPGDAELLTLKALRVIQHADVVVHDRLISSDVMALIPPGVQRIDVGKAARRHSMAQSAINQLLVTLAREGLRVVRLKGGDPLIFGRGGEEMVCLQQHGVNCHIVPGITAAVGCAASCGIPLTHRDFAQSVRFVTGHSRSAELDIDWHGVVAQGQTLVFYMGLTHSTKICQQLTHYGLSASTPVAIVERGTQPQQRVLIATLRTLPQLIAKEQPQSPSLLIVGEVVSLYQQVDRFQQTPQENTYAQPDVSIAAA